MIRQWRSNEKERVYISGSQENNMMIIYIDRKESNKTDNNILLSFTGRILH